MAETYIIPADRVKKLWKIIQAQYEAHLDNAVQEILFPSENEIKNVEQATTALVKIDKLITEHEDSLEKWDRLLHRGKTEKEIREDMIEAFQKREAERKKQLEESQRELSKLFNRSVF